MMNITLGVSDDQDEDRPLRRAARGVAALIGAACRSGGRRGRLGNDGRSRDTTSRPPQRPTGPPRRRCRSRRPAAGSSQPVSSAASSAEWDAIVAAANEEGKVTLYTAQGLDQANQLKAAFEAEYPDITVEVVARHLFEPDPEDRGRAPDRQRHRRRLRLGRHRLVGARPRPTATSSR